MHILYDHQIFSRQNYGGISRYFYELAYNIACLTENKVEIFAPFHFNEYLPLLTLASHKGIKLHRLPIILGPYLVTKLNTAVAYLTLRSRETSDIFHETYYSKSDCKPSSAKRVITIHDMTPEIFSDTYFKGTGLPSLKSYAVQRADHVICVSKNTQRDLINRLSIPKEKTSVIHSGYSLTRSKNAIRPLLSLKPYILYVGVREGYKNFSKVLHVFAGTKKLRESFSLICFGGGSFSTLEHKLINSFGLSRNDIMQLSGTDQLLSGIYSNAKAFVYPSLYEGFGIPLLEAMSCGCPIACSNTSSFPEIVGDAAGLFNPDDEGEICSAIQRIVFHPETARHLVKKGYERIKHFSWEKCALETLAVYEDLLQG